MADPNEILNVLRTNFANVKNAESAAAAPAGRFNKLAEIVAAQKSNQRKLTPEELEIEAAQNQAASQKMMERQKAVELIRQQRLAEEAADTEEVSPYAPRGL